MLGYIIDEETKRLAIFPNGEPSKDLYDTLDIREYEAEKDWHGNYYVKGCAPSQTENDRLQEEYSRELYEKESWLSSHDYIGVKIATGRATVDDYAKEIAMMKEYAARVKELRSFITIMR